jgi:ATP-dependent Clp protease ATP-binding subunit ClpA
VQVEEPSTEATIAILRGLKQRFQDHHGLEIQDAAVVAAANLGARYITGTYVKSLSSLNNFGPLVVHGLLVRL